MSGFPHSMPPVLSAREMRAADKFAIDTIGLPELVLMEHAAGAALRRLREKFGSTFVKTSGVIVAGTGNNGGDAAALYRQLAQAGYDRVSLFVLTADHRSKSLTTQLRILDHLHLPWSEGADQEFSQALDASDWVVDGLFGTGLARPIEGPAKHIVEKINSARKWTLALDIPSGLAADTGKPLGATVRANATLALGYLKRGLVTGNAADFVGEITLDPIEIPRKIYSLHPKVFFFDPKLAELPARPPSGHKGTYGHTYLFCGTESTQGAAGLSTLAALRAGAGLVTLWGDPADVKSLRPRLPLEIMTADYAESTFAKEKNAVGVFGPGMGKSASRWDVLERALDSAWPLVLDGDALTLIAEHAEAATTKISARSAATVLTPHPKEAARLLGTEVAEIERDRYASARKLVDTFRCYVVLKGKGTLISHPEAPTVVVGEGDTGLSKAGSGDILAGLTGAFLGQPGNVFANICWAVYVHGKSSRWVSQRHGTERAHVASDLAEAIPEVLRELEK